MSKINKNLRKIDIYTLFLLLCSMFSCSNYNHGTINNEKLLAEVKVFNLREMLKINNISNEKIESRTRDKCAICLQSFYSDYLGNISIHSESIYMENINKEGCQNMLHEKCLNAWLETNPSCPFCRDIIADTKTIPFVCSFSDTFLENNQNKTIRINSKPFCLLKTDNGVYENKIIYGTVDEIEIEIDEYIKNLAYMFADTKEFKKVKVKISPNVTDMSHMFYKCSNIKSITIEGDTSNVINMKDMFSGCSSLTSLTIEGNISGTNIKDMLNGCKSLKSLTIKDISNVNNIENTFDGFSSIESLTITSDISNISHIKEILNLCSNLKSLTITSDISNISHIKEILNLCSNLKSLTIEGNIDVEDMSGMFNGFSNLESITIKGDTSKVKDMKCMFKGCSKLKEIIGLDNFNTGKVTDMSCMFADCKSLESLPDISKWNTSNVKCMSSLFSGCNSLISLPDISKWNTTNIDNAYDMCNDCITLLNPTPNL